MVQANQAESQTTQDTNSLSVVRGWYACDGKPTMTVSIGEKKSTFGVHKQQFLLQKYISQQVFGPTVFPVGDSWVIRHGGFTVLIPLKLTQNLLTTDSSPTHVLLRISLYLRRIRGVLRGETHGFWAHLVSSEIGGGEPISSTCYTRDSKTVKCWHHSWPHRAELSNHWQADSILLTRMKTLKSKQIEV